MGKSKNKSKENVANEPDSSLSSNAILSTPSGRPQLSIANLNDEVVLLRQIVSDLRIQVEALQKLAYPKNSCNCAAVSEVNYSAHQNSSTVAEQPVDQLRNAVAQASLSRSFIEKSVFAVLKRYPDNKSVTQDKLDADHVAEVCRKLDIPMPISTHRHPCKRS
ncbi:unnamed protein product [Caenorhabditis auriculariae]|uniref:Uncharacterized protein n=1 Tax=Caenorhabditis auriculariae TaxID=2777116 RepID=A0A8S1GPT6_9PELO|nr:unnamed protein product [Caenorhabditis auriculariae]